MAKLQIWIAICRQRKTDPRHWMIIVCPPDHATSTWYRVKHVREGPTVEGPYEYELVISNPKRFDSHGIEEHHYVGELDESDKRKLQASAQNIPVQMCQKWTVEVLGDLERKGLVPAGTKGHWLSKIET